MTDEADLEISDLVVGYDETTLERRPVAWRPVLSYFESRGRRGAARIVRSLPKTGDHFDDAAVDHVLLLSHMELQRVEEEFLHGHRVLDLVRAAVAACEAADVPRPWRIVDVGCGLGYVVRWLTSFGGLGADVELIGVDYNRRFVDVATRLAEEEGLRCRFVVANAFRLAEPATLFISSGVMHHFRGAGLHGFFSAQMQPCTVGFIHTDIRPSWLSPIGAWVYHQARMRQPLARHDGTLSAKRAHSAAHLVQVAEAACPQFSIHLYDRGTLPWLSVFHSLIGVEPRLSLPFFGALAATRALTSDEPHRGALR